MNYKKLRELVDKENLSQNKAAMAFGMSAPGYKDMLDNQTMKVETLEKVASHFKVPVSYFFDEQPGTIADLVEEPNPTYKKTGCEHCSEKDKLIAQLEKRIEDKEQIIELLCKKEATNEGSAQFGEGAKQNKAC